MNHYAQAAPLRILQVTDARSWRGGERQILLLVQGLLARGHQVWVACEPALGRRFREAGVPTVPLHLGGSPLRALPDLVRALRRLRPHLVAAQSSGAHTLALLARTLGGRVPLVVHRRRPSPIGRWSLWKYRSPAVRRYVAISRYVAETLQQAGVPEQRIAVVPSGLRFPLPPVPRREDLDLPEERPIVGTVAAFTREKNLEFWLKVVAHLRQRRPEVVPVLVGEGYLEPMLRRRARDLGLAGALRILRYRPGIAGVFTLFLSTSRVEGLGTALMEALAYGVPVVAPRVGGIPEVVRHRETGWLVDSWRTEDFVAALRRLLEDAEERRRLAEAARRDIPARFSANRMVDATVEVYREVLR